MFEHLENKGLIERMLTDKIIHHYTWRKYLEKDNQLTKWRKWLLEG